MRLALLWACAGSPPSFEPGGLPPCPASPTCVSSLPGTSPAQAVEPLPYLRAPALQYALSQIGCTVVRAEPTWVHATCATAWLGFVDDVLLRTEGERIQVRSASRVGRHDLGENRRRVERLRAVVEGFDERP